MAVLWSLKALTIDVVARTNADEVFVVGLLAGDDFLSKLAGAKGGHGGQLDQYLFGSSWGLAGAKLAAELGAEPAQ